ncbi:unnamed protein product, partial [Cyprideis torosa]
YKAGFIRKHGTASVCPATCGIRNAVLQCKASLLRWSGLQLLHSRLRSDQRCAHSGEPEQDHNFFRLRTAPTAQPNGFLGEPGSATSYVSFSSPPGPDKHLATLEEFKDCSDFEEESEHLLNVELKRKCLEDVSQDLRSKFDCEGFGEIPCDVFLQTVIPDEKFRTQIDPDKLEVLRVKALANPTSVITVQAFIDVVTGKRTRSYKCAVHCQDGEVYSLNDYKIQIEPQAPFDKMVRIVAGEFLQEERDRKYYADQYRCWPPPLFVFFVTLIEEERDRKYYADQYRCWPPPLFVFFVTLIEVNGDLLSL